MGDDAQDTVLLDQVQAVKEGDGITILPDGTIEVNSQTARGLMRLGQTAAYADSAFNGYWWPQTVSSGDLDKQITIKSIDSNGYAILQWSDSDGIDWTERGQLIAATAAGETNDDLVDIGSDRSFLMSQVDNGLLTTGLAYSDVVTSSMKTPAGSQGQRPLSPVRGEFRFNTTQTKLEVWSGTSWETVASEDPVLGGYVRQIKSSSAGQTDVAAIPAGTTAQRISSPIARGYLRYNSTQNRMEFWGGTQWETIASQPGPTPQPLGTVSSVDVSGGATGLTFSGGPVTTTGTITMSGTLDVDNGGTGATTPNGALTNLLPPQAGRAGYYLQTNGTVTNWGQIIIPPPFDTGTRIVFFQAAAPTGWTKVTGADVNNAALRLVQGNGGGTGGSIPFSTLFSSSSSYSGVVNITSGQVGFSVLSEGQLASHFHRFNNNPPRRGTSGGGGRDGADNNYNVPTSSTGGNQAHTHTLAGVAANGNFVTNFAVKYVDVIVAQKN